MRILDDEVEDWEADLQDAHPRNPALNTATRTLLLVRLLPGREDDPIGCEMIHLAQARQPKYDASSYTWGSETNQQETVMNEQLLFIRETFGFVFVSYDALEKAMLYGSTPFVLTSRMFLNAIISFRGWTKYTSKQREYLYGLQEGSMVVKK